MSETRIVVVASNKGGVGKSTVAYHLAGALGGVLVDLDWEMSGATTLWGAPDLVHAKGRTLVDWLEEGPDAGSAPRVRRTAGRPDLVASHTDLSDVAVDEGLVGDCLLAWAEAWGSEWVVVDTHPGSGVLRNGAISVADLVVVPVLLSQHEIVGTREFVTRELDGHNCLLVVNKVPAGAGRRLTRLAAPILELESAHVATGPVIREYRWLPSRLRRQSLTYQYPNGDAARAGTPAAAAQTFREIASTITDLTAKEVAHG